MNILENLIQEANDGNVNVIDYPFRSERIKGLYCDGTVALNKEIHTTNEKACVLAEELGHHYTTVGNIIDLKKPENRKQEQRARVWAYDKLISLDGIIRMYEAGCRTLHESAEYLDVTEEFLAEALKHYRNRYGLSARVGDYIIFFEPTLGILKII